jgi:hypothetical protein
VLRSSDKIFVRLCAAICIESKRIFDLKNGTSLGLTGHAEFVTETGNTCKSLIEIPLQP